MRGKDQRDRRVKSRCNTSTSQNEVDQRSSCSAVAVHEGMDRFKLCVSKSGLHYRRKRVVIAKDDQIFHQLPHRLWRWRDKRGSARVIVAPTDPVLDRSKLTALIFEPRSSQQKFVNL